MPWTSVQQARWGHSPAGKKALGSSKVKEFDAATEKGSLKGTKGSKGVSRSHSKGSTRVDTYQSKNTKD